MGVECVVGTYVGGVRRWYAALLQMTQQTGGFFKSMHIFHSLFGGKKKVPVLPQEVPKV